MNPRLKLKLSKVLSISIFWMVGAIFFTIYDHLVLSSNYSSGASEIYSFRDSIYSAIIASIISSGLGATFLIFFIGEKFRDRSYGYTLVAVSIAFVTIVLIITTLLGLIFSPIQTGKPLSDPITWQLFIENYTNPFMIKTAMIWYVIVLLTEFFLQIDNKFGKGILRKFIIGQYRNPIQETRVFMFLDINKSTEIAEDLGNEKYHQFLKDFFSDITDPIINNQGEIYQYVGDEVVISWNLNSGLSAGQCIQCFIDIKAKINEESEKYRIKYSLVPAFKAGIHCGKVIAGEIGIIKRDITYSGDTLNTTSRIQSKCHDFKTDILASGALIELLPKNIFNFEKIGLIDLRGKSEQIELLTIK